MIRKLALSAIVGLSGVAYGDVDLQPQMMTVDLGGAQVHRVYFRDGEKKFAVRINQETEVRSGEGGAVFRFKAVRDGEMALRPSPLPPTAKFDDPVQAPKYAAAAKSLVGGNGTVLEQSSPVPDALPFNDWTSSRITLNVQYPDGDFTKDVIFLNLSPTQQVLVVITARTAEMEQTRAWARKMMERWHQVLPTDESGEN